MTIDLVLFVPFGKFDLGSDVKGGVEFSLCELKVVRVEVLLVSSLVSLAGNIVPLYATHCRLRPRKEIDRSD